MAFYFLSGTNKEIRKRAWHFCSTHACNVHVHIIGIWKPSIGRAGRPINFQSFPISFNLCVWTWFLRQFVHHSKAKVFLCETYISLLCVGWILVRETSHSINYNAHGFCKKGVLHPRYGQSLLAFCFVLFSSFFKNKCTARNYRMKVPVL